MEGALCVAAIFTSVMPSGIADGQPALSASVNSHLCWASRVTSGVPHMPMWRSKICKGSNTVILYTVVS